MGSSPDNPRPWTPYTNSNRDCSQGFCSLYCPQWCYIIFPPPPPLSPYSPFSSSSTSSSVPGHSFSPLVISIIGILASALLLVSYYAIISKYCGNMDSSSRNIQDQMPEDELEGEGRSSSWMRNTGLDEALIKSISVSKYKKSDGLSMDCSVCLGEFEDDEELRILPKCKHGFHVDCIDTWLKSHSNCPLCRANVALSAFNDHEEPHLFQPALPAVLMLPHPSVPQNDYDDLQNRHQQQHNDRGHEAESTHQGDDERGSRNEQRVWENHFRALSDLGDSELRHSTIIDIRDGSCRQSDSTNTTVRRSFSMDNSCQLRQLSIADILGINQEDGNVQMEDIHEQIGSSLKESAQLAETSKSNSSSSRSKVLHCVKNSVAMKRSFWIERSLSAGTRYGRRRLNAVLPL